MRLKEDNGSWRAGGILRRDFRHDAGLPETEVPRGKPKKKAKKPRNRIGHKHIWTDWQERERYAWWLYDARYSHWPRDIPTYYLHKDCTISGCKASKWKKNPRYGYLNAKWNRKRRLAEASKEVDPGR